MNSTNKTLYIPLYGKALVSRKGIILHDPKAETIWKQEGFPLKGKPKSKWLAYYMGMRAWVMDQWLAEQLEKQPKAVVLHLGCGLDSRCQRVAGYENWYDVDMPSVIEVRRQYFEENETYHMIGCDVLEADWMQQLPDGDQAIVVMEGLSMYLPMAELQKLLQRLQEKYPEIHLIMDVYTGFGVKASAYKNPIQTVGASVCTGIDEPTILESGKLRFVQELTMTPEEKIRELSAMEQNLFRLFFAGTLAKKIYRMYTYRSK